MNFKYYLFDLDNCILHNPDPSDYFDNILVTTLEKYSITIPNKKKRNEFWFEADNGVETLRSHDITDISGFWKDFDELDYENRIQLIENKKIYLFKDVKPVLEELFSKNIKLALVSNSPNYIVELIIEKFDLKEIFSEFLLIDYTLNPHLAKPSPNGILDILNRFKYNSKTSKALMIGDSMNDIIAAKRAKIYSCLIIRDSASSSQFNENLHPDFIIKDMHELLLIEN